MLWNFLIVDDSKTLRVLVRRVLTLSSLAIGQIYEAGNGKEAIEILHREHIDMVLADLNMPGMTGRELVEYVRGVAALASTRILIMTTERSQPKLLALQALGINGYLTKPFGPEQLRDMVLELANKSTE